LAFASARGRGPFPIREGVFDFGLLGSAGGHGAACDGKKEAEE